MPGKADNPSGLLPAAILRAAARHTAELLAVHRSRKRAVRRDFQADLVVRVCEAWDLAGM